MAIYLNQVLSVLYKPVMTFHEMKWNQVSLLISLNLDGSTSYYHIMDLQK